MGSSARTALTCPVCHVGDVATGRCTFCPYADYRLIVAHERGEKMSNEERFIQQWHDVGEMTVERRQHWQHNIGKIVDHRTRVYMERHDHLSYPQALHAVLDADVELKLAYSL